MQKNHKIDVSPQSKNSDYTITIGENIISHLGQFINEQYSDHQLVVITDENVHRDQFENLVKHLDEKNIHLIVNKPGEISKSREVKNRRDDELLSKNFTRKTLLIAFGGGVVGDLTGYIAATYKRGIPFVQVPTSLLAMVDSSVGGKTGINTKYGKNLIGAFWQPSAVFADINMLESLPQEEFLNGFAECIKAALILDANLFEYMETNIDAILQRKTGAVIHIIKRCVELKKEVVNLDTREKGIRQILNFGHTIGHAMETLSHYQIKHGFGVSIGMAVELKMSQLSGEISDNDYWRVIDFFDKAGMPHKVPADFSVEKICEIMLSDKKAEKGVIKYVLLDKIGKYREANNKFSFSLGDEIVRESINSCKKNE
ncbi:MAG: 3-dehydroquinate synthase [Fidelibacterota bacterium]